MNELSMKKFSLCQNSYQNMRIYGQWFGQTDKQIQHIC